MTQIQCGWDVGPSHHRFFKSSIYRNNNKFYSILLLCMVAVCYISIVSSSSTISSTTQHVAKAQEVDDYELSPVASITSDSDNLNINSLLLIEKENSLVSAPIQSVGLEEHHSLAHASMGGHVSVNDEVDEKIEETSNLQPNDLEFDSNINNSKNNNNKEIIKIVTKDSLLSAKVPVTKQNTNSVNLPSQKLEEDKQREVLTTALKNKRERVLNRNLLKNKLKEKRQSNVVLTESHLNENKAEEGDDDTDLSNPSVLAMTARQTATQEHLEKNRVGEPYAFGLTLNNIVIYGVVAITVCVISIGIFILRSGSGGVREVIYEKEHYKRPEIDETDCASGDPASVSICKTSPIISSYYIEHYGANIPIEDKYQAIIDPTTNNAFFGVYDGHGGPMAADFTIKNLYKCLQEAFKNKDLSTQSAFEHAYVATDNLFQKKCIELFQRGQKKAATVGTCALTAYIHDNTITIANVGDSRAVLGQRNPETQKLTIKSVSNEHNARDINLQNELKSSHPNEENIVVQKRDAFYIKGRLQLTRSLGDFYLKNADFNTSPLPERSRVQGPYSPPYITSMCEVTSHTITTMDEFLILASDGYSEVCTDKDTVELMEQYNSTNPDHGPNPASYLRKIAVERAAAEFNIGYSQIIRVPAGERRRDIHDDITIIFINLKAQQVVTCNNKDLSNSERVGRQSSPSSHQRNRSRSGSADRPVRSNSVIAAIAGNSSMPLECEDDSDDEKPHAQNSIRDVGLDVDIAASKSSADSYLLQSSSSTSMPVIAVMAPSTATSAIVG